MEPPCDCVAVVLGHIRPGRIRPYPDLSDRVRLSGLLGSIPLYPALSRPILLKPALSSPSRLRPALSCPVQFSATSGRSARVQPRRAASSPALPYPIVSCLVRPQSAVSGCVRRCPPLFGPIGIRPHPALLGPVRPHPAVSGGAWLCSTLSGRIRPHLSGHILELPIINHMRRLLKQLTRTRSLKHDLQAARPSVWDSDIHGINKSALRGHHSICIFRAVPGPARTGPGLVCD